MNNKTENVKIASPALEDEVPELGDRIRDRISGIEGICIGITDWLYGCRRLVLQPTENKDGKPADSFSLDEPQVEVIRKTEIIGRTKTTHGERDDRGGNCQKISNKIMDLYKLNITLEDIKTAYETGANDGHSAVFGGEQPDSEIYIETYFKEVMAVNKGLTIYEMLTKYKKYESELLPCPFCADARIRILPQNFGYSIDCIRCGAGKQYHGKEIEGAVFEWNNRPFQKIIP